MIDGHWHPEGSAKRISAKLEIRGESYALDLEGGSTFTGSLADLSLSQRIGNIERKITLPDGSIFTTADNEAIDDAFKRNAFSFVHMMESSLKWVAVALIVTVISVFSFFRWGVPALSHQVAHALPESTNVLITDGVLKFLDKAVFEKSKLDKSRQEEIHAHFLKKLVPYGGKDKNYTLHFRDWPGIPNALALPSGDIVITDKLIELAKSQEEIDSVLLHEMGHVEHRHSLEMIIEGSVIAISIMTVIGDLSAMSDMGVGLGTAMISSHYARGHETEADEFAFKKMLLAKMDPAAFSRIMSRMENEIRGKPKKIRKKGEKKEKSILDYFSSHPNTDDRVKMANQYSSCFKRSQLSCDLSR